MRVDIREVALFIETVPQSTEESELRYASATPTERASR